MLRTSRKVHALRAGSRRRRALVDLWAGECNCPYWHGVFGGIYLPHIRRATFGHLIAADVRAEQNRRVAGTIADLDGDGAPDVELVSPAMLLAVDPDEGEIGRASCRERGEGSVGGIAVKRKHGEGRGVERRAREGTE